MSAAVLEKPETRKAAEQRCVLNAPVAVYENGDAYIVLLQMPGADEKAIQVRMDKGVLTVEAPLKVELPQGATPRYCEMRLGDFRRVLDFEDKVDAEKIDANFKGGLLKLTMPKSKTARARKIPIKTA